MNCQTKDKNIKKKESQYDRVARLNPDPHDMTPEQCLNALPGVYQSIGKVGIMASRCDPDSKLGKERWELHGALNGYGMELMSKIRWELNKDIIGKYMRNEITHVEFKEEMRKRKGQKK